MRRLALLALLPYALAACESEITGPDDDPPEAAPTANRIAFSSNRSGKYEVYTMALDGTDVRKASSIDGPSEHPNHPSWSGDGRTLVYSVAFDDFTVGAPVLLARVRAMDPGGGNDRLLADDGWKPSVGPGGRIVYVDQGADLVVIDADGSGRTQVAANSEFFTSTEPGVSTQAWRPDGWIGFNIKVGHLQEPFAVERLVAIRADGSEVEGYGGVEAPGTDSWDLTFAPSGDIAFTSEREGRQDVWVTDFGAGVYRRLASDAAPDYAPAWSPDGTRVAWVSRRDGNAEIYVANRDGTDVRRLTNHPGVDTQPTWAPLR